MRYFNRMKMSKTPCNVVELDGRETFEVSLAENIQHETLNPIDEARAFKRQVGDYGYGGISELARRVGRSQEYISGLLHRQVLPLRTLITSGRRPIVGASRCWGT